MRYITGAERIGMERGTLICKKETARNLLLMGRLTVNEISQATGLSVKEVENIGRDSETNRLCVSSSSV